jgi:hypothetical protein
MNKQNLLKKILHLHQNLPEEQDVKVPAEDVVVIDKDQEET